MKSLPHVARRWPTEFGHTSHNNFVVADLRGRGGLEPFRDGFRALGCGLIASSMADELLVLEDVDGADAAVHVLGGDGREADLCGNGLIYLAAKLGDELGRDTVTFDTAIGLRTATRQQSRWEVEIGRSKDLDTVGFEGRHPELAARKILGAVHTGEPHVVVGAPLLLGGFHVDPVDFEEYCAPLRDAFDVEGGVNVTVVFETDEEFVLIRTYERGTRRMTQSCGTGAAAATAVLYDQMACEQPVTVVSPGGRHTVRCEEGRFYIAARPQALARGMFEDGELRLPIDHLFRFTRAGREASLDPLECCDLEQVETL